MTSSPDPLVILLVLIGPAAGSFLALLADRLPRGEPVTLTRSRCRSCGAVLGAAELLPVLSFAIRRGRCGRCGGAIPPWLLYTEIAAAGAAVLAALAASSAAQAWGAAVFLWVLLALAVTDLTRFRLPDALTGTLALVASGLACAPGGVGWAAALTGALAGAGSFALLRTGYRRLRKREGLGAGDVKLIAGLGAFAGPQDLPLLVLAAALCALTGGLIAAWASGGRGPALGQRALPFGAALCLAAAMLWLMRQI